MADRGLTHIAFAVADLDASIAFYREYAEMRVVHQRGEEDGHGRVAWISDGTRPFVLVLIEQAEPERSGGAAERERPRNFSHLGVACAEREQVDRLCARARDQGILEMKPRDLGPPVGYFGLIRDPDGNHLEISHGQEVGLAVLEDGAS